jgi:hypothetical protein
MRNERALWSTYSNCVQRQTTLLKRQDGTSMPTATWRTEGRSLVWSLSSLRTVENPRCCHPWDGVLCSPEPILSQHLVCSHCSFWAKCLLYYPDPGACASMVVKQANAHQLHSSQARFRDGNNTRHIRVSGRFLYIRKAAILSFQEHRLSIQEIPVCYCNMPSRCASRGSGWSKSICMACNAQEQGTIKVVELTTPSVSERRMPALHAWDLPKSSALMISKRASSGYPNKRLVWLLCDWVIVPISPLDCFACSIPVVLLSIKQFSSNGWGR